MAPLASNGCAWATLAASLLFQKENDAPQCVASNQSFQGTPCAGVKDAVDIGEDISPPPSFADRLQTAQNAIKLVVKNTSYDVEEEMVVAKTLGRSVSAPNLQLPDIIANIEDYNQQELVNNSVAVVASTVNPCLPSISDCYPPDNLNSSQHVMSWGTLGAPMLQPFLGQWPAFPQQQPRALPLPIGLQNIPAMSTFDRAAYSSVPLQSTSFGVEAGSRVDYSTTEEDWVLVGEAPKPCQPQSITEYANQSTGGARLFWTVDARKLRSNDRQTVSPLFHISDRNGNASPLPCKMIITPVPTSDKKGGSSFRNAEGRATVQLKCEASRADLENSPINIYFSAVSTVQENARQLDQRGPLRCNFAKSGIVSLPKQYDMWDLPQVVDEQSQTFAVCLEVEPLLQH